MNSVSKGRRLLIGEDEPEVRGYLEMSLKCLGYSVEFAEDGDEVVTSLRDRSSPIDAVLLGLVMRNRDGIETLKEIRRTDPFLPVIMVSDGGHAPSDVIHAVKCGATDFLCKPLAHETLEHALAKAIEVRDSCVSAAALSSHDVRSRAFVGTSPKIREIYELIGKIGWSEAPVLILGETGSGKEVLARELHAQSPRAGKPFLKLNCAALPSELVESELFGYEKGAFTGAFQKKLGMFEMADGGTIMLDEIGDMDVRLQAKLLQVLQDQEFQRIGGKETIHVDVRVIAATHRNLEKGIAESNFREDLYYRLNVIMLNLPPLRERTADILPLAEFLWKKHSGNNPMPTTPNLRQILTTYHWPGNVRELENVIRRLAVFRDPEIIVRDLSARSSRKLAGAVRTSPEVSDVRDDMLVAGPPVLAEVTKAQQQAEVEVILAALNTTRWNRKQAAALLKVDYKALLYKMKKLGVEDNVITFGPNRANSGAKVAATGTA